MKLSWRGRKAAGNASRWPGSGYAESTFAQLAWERTRKRVARWGWAGAILGGLVALLAFAPAAWLAQAVAAGTNQRLLLADARGTVWNGSAMAMLTGGASSRTAALLPGRTSWSVGLRGLSVALRVRQDCCMEDELVLLWRPGLGRMALQLAPAQGQRAEWPAAWLAGLGAPWNTLQLSGLLRLSSPGMTLELTGGRWRLAGQAELALSDIGSSLSTLDRLGSYRVQVLTPAAGTETPSITLSTQDGSLLLSGQGQWTGSQLRFRGEARAAPGFESALDNLLNLLGRRQGAMTLISIG